MKTAFKIVSHPDSVNLVPEIIVSKSWLFGPATDLEKKSIIYPCTRYHCLIPWSVFWVLSKSTPSVAHPPVRVATVMSANRTLLTTLTSMLSSTMAVSFAIKSPKESQISISLPWILQRRNIQVYVPPAVGTAITDVPSHHILSVLVTNYLLSSSRCGVKRERNGWMIQKTLGTCGADTAICYSGALKICAAKSKL